MRRYTNGFTERFTTTGEFFFFFHLSNLNLRVKGGVVVEVVCDVAQIYLGYLKQVKRGI